MFFLRHQLQSCTKRSHVEEQLECNECSAALSSLSPPVCPLPPSPPSSSSPTNAHVLDVRTWHGSHHASKFSPSALLRHLTQARCPLVPSLFFAHPTLRNTSAQPPAMLPSRGISHNILRFDQPMDTSQTSHPIQQRHSNFNVAIKRSACSRGLGVGLTNTSCCGVCSAQPHRKCGEGWPLPLRQAKR